jgi:putative restriction endonuclease
MDVRNGLAACPIHDAAFDQGYLTVDQTNHVHRASILLQSIMTDPGVEAYFGKIVRSILVLPVEAKQPHARYLDYHQREIFRS